jgi:DNA adenine methylase
MYETDAFLELMEKTPISIRSWRDQKSIYQNCDISEPLALGFAAFFLNRTNRSGIIGSGGVIGGLSQNGNYLIDCRFNKDGLSKRIKRIAKYRDLIHLSNLDAVDFMKYCKEILPKNSLLCVDPPYFAKGASLYANSYKPSDHALVATEILKLDAEKISSKRLKYIVTYDNVEQIRELYASRRQYTFNLNYSAQVKRIGTELLIASQDISIPTDVEKHELKAVA